MSLEMISIILHGICLKTVMKKSLSFLKIKINLRLN
jgi:hypothetical protein